MSTATLHTSCRLGANILRSSKQRNHALGDFNPPQTSEERVFQRRLGRKIWALACSGDSRLDEKISSIFWNENCFAIVFDQWRPVHELICINVRFYSTNNGFACNLVYKVKGVLSFIFAQQL